MARDHGRIMSSIWNDEEFIALGIGPQWLYEFFLTQADLSYAGVLAMRMRRWASRSAGLTSAALEQYLEALTAARFVVADHDTEEVLVRTLIRNDGVWKQPNLMKAAVKDAREIMSPTLRRALADEVARIPVHELSDVPGKASPSPRVIVTTCVADLLEHLLADLDGTPAETLPETPTETPPARVPLPLSPSPTPGEEPSSAIADAITDTDTAPAFLAPDVASSAPERPELLALCEHLADRIEANGSRRPRIGQRWLTATRLLLDADGRTVDQVHAAIDWSQTDPFWRANVLSMPKLREKYDQLRLAAMRAQRSGDRQFDHLRDAYAWAQQHDAAQQRHDLPALGAS